MSTKSAMATNYKVLLYHPENCPKCKISKKRAKFDYLETIIHDNVTESFDHLGNTIFIPNAEKTREDLRQRNFRSFPVFFVLKDPVYENGEVMGGYLVDQWSDLNIDKIDNWNGILAGDN